LLFLYNGIVIAWLIAFPEMNETSCPAVTIIENSASKSRLCGGFAALFGTFALISPDYTANVPEYTIMHTSQVEI